MKYIVILLCILTYSSLFGQSQTKKALFLGNSYTAANSLPQMVADVAASTDDTLIFDSNTPGGYTLQEHSSNQITLNKIVIGNWDYVILQEQSQLPSFPIAQVESDVFPYAKILDSLINVGNTCGETVFYMTWGRKNGDAANCSFWPPVCTYEGMDSLLNLRYRMMADSNDAILSPVGAVWKYIRQSYPFIELYLADESHPSVAGTYAAACCFYSSLFRKDPTYITFNSTLSASDAANIRAAAKLIVYDSLSNWHIGEYDPFADFNYYTSGDNQITFTNTSLNATLYNWDFGDGDTSTLANPTHLYSTIGSYTVTLISGKCGKQDTAFQTVMVGATGIESQDSDNLTLSIFPNPFRNFIIIEKESQESPYSTLEIYNLQGQIVHSDKLDNFRQKISLAHIPQGYYYLRTIQGNMIQTRKIIKLH